MESNELIAVPVDVAVRRCDFGDTTGGTNELTRIEKAVELAASIFEDAQFAKDWLNRPNLATDEKAPIALLGTAAGLTRVETLLHRIEYGILA